MVNAATVIAVSVTFCTLALVCVALRFNARRKTAPGIRADDYWALFALVIPQEPVYQCITNL